MEWTCGGVLCVVANLSRSAILPRNAERPVSALEVDFGRCRHLLRPRLYVLDQDQNPLASSEAISREFAGGCSQIGIDLNFRFHFALA